MHRARLAKVSFYTAEWMRTCTDEDIVSFYRFNDKDITKTCPLVHQRRLVLNETGNWLIQHYKGSFANFIRTCGNSAVLLAQKLAEELPSFNDTGVFPEVDPSPPSTQSAPLDQSAEYERFLASPLQAFSPTLPDSDWKHHSPTDAQHPGISPPLPLVFTLLICILLLSSVRFRNACLLPQACSDLSI